MSNDNQLLTLSSYFELGPLPATEAPPTEIPDKPCPIDKNWIVFGDYCYKFYSEIDDEMNSWWKSRELCQKYGADLASVHTYEENYWILSKVIHHYSNLFYS